jgi:cystathionine beta-lyase/cystathionine gamma-synthase
MTKTWQTRLVHPEVKVPQDYHSLATPVYRGATTVFPSAAAVHDDWDQLQFGYTYGLYGTPTSLELAARICELESGSHTILTPGARLRFRSSISRCSKLAITFSSRTMSMSRTASSSLSSCHGSV